RRLGFFYHPACVALFAALILTATGIAVIDWSDIVHDAGGLYRFSAIPEIWLTVWTVVALHELAHGLTCKRHGGEVHEVGLLLIYFQPAAYCNVSDAWLFREKRQRLLVTLAGPWFELGLWALATLVWRVTDGEAWIHELALIVVATSGIKTLVNLNPFLKLDGYYLLSDLLEVPNLRRRAFEHVGAWTRALFGSTEPGLIQSTARERRIYLTYGLLAIAFSAVFLLLLTMRLGHMLIG